MLESKHLPSGTSDRVVNVRTLPRISLVYVSTPKRTQMAAKLRSASNDRGINENDFIILPYFGTVKGSVVLSSVTNPTIRHFAGADDPRKQM
jgi:hypothetical protein